MIGFLGAGNMAGALIRGMARGGLDRGEIMVYDVNPARMEEMRAFGVRLAESPEAMAKWADFVVLAVKPKDCDAALKGISACKNLVSIVVSATQERLQSAVGKGCGVLRLMPNTPALVGEGVLAVNENHSLTDADYDTLCGMLSRCGTIERVPEALFSAVSAMSGSGPAYVYLFIEALADAGVVQGIPRETAYRLAAQTVLGAGGMVLETGKHPGALKDEVCSPGGTTIEAVYALEKAGLRGAVMDAVTACADKAARMTDGGVKR